MKRKLSFLLVFVLLLTLLPAHAFAESGPTFYYYNGHSIALLETTSFTEAIAKSQYGALIVDGGTITISKGMELGYCDLLLNNAQLVLKKGNCNFFYYPTLCGNSSITVSSGAKYNFYSDGGIAPYVGSAKLSSIILKSGSIRFVPTGGKGAINMQQPTKATQSVEAALHTTVVETITISGSATITTFAAVSSDTLVVSKGAKVTIDSDLSISGAKFENNGTLQVDGALVISNDIPKNFQAPDFSNYDLNDPDQLQRFYSAYYQLLKRYSGAMSNQPGSKFENKGAIQGDGILFVMGASAMTNYGSLKCYSVYNEGKITNHNGSVDCLLFGTPINSANNSNTRILTFHLIQDSMLYATSVTGGKAFSKVSRKNVQSVIDDLAPWYSDAARSKPWNKSTPVTADIEIYNSYL